MVTVTVNDWPAVIRLESEHVRICDAGAGRDGARDAIRVARDRAEGPRQAGRQGIGQDEAAWPHPGRRSTRASRRKPRSLAFTWPLFGVFTTLTSGHCTVIWPGFSLVPSLADVILPVLSMTAHEAGVVAARDGHGAAVDLVLSATSAGIGRRVAVDRADVAGQDLGTDGAGDRAGRAGARGADDATSSVRRCRAGCR